MTFPWNCPMCPQSSFHSSPTLMLYNLVGSVTKEELSLGRRSRNCILSDKRRNPLDSIFVWSWSKKLKTFHVTADRTGRMPGSRCLYDGGSWWTTAWGWGRCKKLKTLHMCVLLSFINLSRRILAGKCQGQDVSIREGLGGQLPVTRGVT